MPNCGCPPPYEKENTEDGCGLKQFIKSNIYNQNDFDIIHEILSFLIL